mgnify:CR=1 FL=1
MWYITEYIRLLLNEWRYEGIGYKKVRWGEMQI